MLFAKLFCVALVFVAQASSSAVPARPNYLTEEDFARAKLLPPVGLNGTIFDPPHHEVKRPDFGPRNAWRHGTWPNARVPYTLDPNFDNNQRAEVARALDNYHSKTCVRFEPRQGGDNDYVEIQRDDNTCGLANVCRNGGAQFARFGGSCISSGTMTHELGHTLCFGHEQTRPDRDDYISWNTNICEPHGRDNANDFTTLDLMYDYVSLQHYEGECYNGCIIPRISGVTKCGSGGDLSVLDVEKINAFYNCGGCYSYRFRPMNLLSPGENLVYAGNGINGEGLYPCRAYYNGDIVVGKGDPNARTCHIGYGGIEHEIRDNFEILTNPRNANVQWRRRPDDGSFPGNAIRGGRSAEREAFYIGRCTLQMEDGRQTTIPGKIHRSAANGVYVAFGGLEYICTDYDILVCE
jgi:hypothetical protein